LSETTARYEVVAMTERDDQLSEGFLVDGVAPSVIGGDPEPMDGGMDGGYVPQAGPQPDHQADHQHDFRPDPHVDFRPGTRREPPTTPIPAQAGQLAQGPPGAQQPADQRKGWLGRVFGRP
jgi:hypothetical protein